MVADGDRIVLADHLSEVARRGEVMVQAAVGDEKDLPARFLAVDHFGDIDAGLAHQIAPQFDHDFRRRQAFAPGRRAADDRRWA